MSNLISNAGFPLTKRTIGSMLTDYNWFYLFEGTNAGLNNPIHRIPVGVFTTLIEDPSVTGDVHFHYALAGYEFTYVLQLTQDGNETFFKLENDNLTPSSALEMETLKTQYLSQTQIRRFNDGMVFSVQNILTHSNPDMGIPTRCSYSKEQFMAYFNNNAAIIWSDIPNRTPNPNTYFRVENGADFLNTYAPAGHANMFKMQVPILSLESNLTWCVSDQMHILTPYLEKGMDSGTLCPPLCN